MQYKIVRINMKKITLIVSKISQDCSFFPKETFGLFIYHNWFILIFYFIMGVFITGKLGDRGRRRLSRRFRQEKDLTKDPRLPWKDPCTSFKTVRITLPYEEIRRLPSRLVEK